jgi:hypothetical protein
MQHEKVRDKLVGMERKKDMLLNYKSLFEIWGYVRSCLCARKSKVMPASPAFNPVQQALINNSKFIANRKKLEQEEANTVEGHR